MRKIGILCSLIVFSLFIMSADRFYNKVYKKIKNADLIGYAGVDDPFKDTYIDFYTVDGSNKLIRTTSYGYGDGIKEYLITTNMETQEEIIKNASITLPYFPVDETGNPYGNPSGYTVYNKEYFLDNFVEPNDKARVSEWLDLDSLPKPEGEYFVQPVVIYGDAFLGEDPYDFKYEFVILTKAFYMPLQDVYGNGSQLILEIANLPAYKYEEIVQGNADQITTINFKNTLKIKKTVPNLQ